jgi:aminomethyltransferase
VGLGARDTLRLEMGMPLYGHELSAERNAATAFATADVAPASSRLDGQGSTSRAAACRRAVREDGLRQAKARQEFVHAGSAGFTKAIAADKHFVGSEVVLAPGGRKETLVGIVLGDRRAARQSDAVLDAAQSRRVGTVTSGSFAPSLKTAVCLAYVEREFATPGIRVMVATARQALPGTVSELPFYKHGTARRPIEEFL